MTISSEELAQRVFDEDLIGFNIHYRKADKTWNVWTRKHGSDGWNRSGWCEDLEEALRGCMDGPAPPEEDWEDLI